MAHDISERDQPQLGIVQVGERRYVASCRMTWDGIEYVGRLWFIDESGSDGPLPDRGALPGRTPADVIALARNLSHDELERRLLRAQLEKRTYLGLRRVTDEILAKVRYINQLVISARVGLLDPEGAAGEIDLTERQMHQLIARLREHAGVADGGE